MPIVPLLILLFVAWVVRWVLVEGNPNRGVRPGADPEVARLRGEVDELSAQVRRLDEEHAFMLRLLTESDKPAATLPPSEKPAPAERPNPEMHDGDA
jgi:hypothetical protein